PQPAAIDAAQRQDQVDGDGELQQPIDERRPRDLLQQQVEKDEGVVMQGEQQVHAVAQVVAQVGQLQQAGEQGQQEEHRHRRVAVDRPVELGVGLAAGLLEILVD